MKTIAIILVIIVVLAPIIWLAWEAITAPTIDDSGHVISDPYNRTKGGSRKE